MNVKASFLASGLTTRQHGNTRRLPKHALKLDEVKNFVTFVTNYAERNAILLPGRIPGYKQDDIQLLPSCTTKKVKLPPHSYTCIPEPKHWTHTPPTNHRLEKATHVYVTDVRMHTPYVHCVRTCESPYIVHTHVLIIDSNWDARNAWSNAPQLLSGNYLIGS